MNSVDENKRTESAYSRNEMQSRNASSHSSDSESSHSEPSNDISHGTVCLDSVLGLLYKTLFVFSISVE